MRELFRAINGRKTYIGVIILTVFGLLATFDLSVPAWAWTIVSGWTGVAITHKANRGIAAVRDAAGQSEAAARGIAGLRHDNWASAGGNGQMKG